LMFAAYLYIRRSRWVGGIRAVAKDPDTASIMGFTN
jgi:branched-subunit amino acid ABC-type transport system permease component